MPNFSGVHGTQFANAVNIQTIGFIIDSFEEYRRMFGNGVYMYKNDENGRLYALEWAKSKISNGKRTKEGICLLFVDFSFGEGEYIEWSEEEELTFNRWLNKHIKNDFEDKRIPRETQNKYRLLFVSAAIEGMQSQYKVIFANMPFPKHLSEHGKYRYKACAVKDVSILPPPPYLQKREIL